MSRLTSKEDFVTSAGLRREDVDTEAGIITVQEFTVAQRKAYITYLKVKDNLPTASAVEMAGLARFVASMGIVDGEGDRIFPTVEDMPEMASAVIEKCATRILQLSGILPEDKVLAEIPNVKENLSTP